MKKGRPPYHVKSPIVAPLHKGEEDFARLVDPNYSYRKYEAELRSRAVPTLNPDDFLFTESGEVDTYSDIKWNNPTPEYGNSGSSDASSERYGRQGQVGHLVLPPPPPVPADPIGYNAPAPIPQSGMKYLSDSDSYSHYSTEPRFLSSSDSYSSYSIPGVTREYHASLAENRRNNARRITQIANDSPHYLNSSDTYSSYSIPE